MTCSGRGLTGPMKYLHLCPYIPGIKDHNGNQEPALYIRHAVYPSSATALQILRPQTPIARVSLVRIDRVVHGHVCALLLRVGKRDVRMGASGSFDIRSRAEEEVSLTLYFRLGSQSRLGTTYNAFLIAFWYRWWTSHPRRRKISLRFLMMTASDSAYCHMGT